MNEVSNSFNGFGGKVEVGETPLQGAARELKVSLPSNTEIVIYEYRYIGRG